MNATEFKCKLCGVYYYDKEMSEEHYPARSLGNEDIVALDICKMIDSFKSEEMYYDILKRLSSGKSFEKISGDIFDTSCQTTISRGRTARTLCRKCNLLGKYDAAYLKFFSLDGEAKN